MHSHHPYYPQRLSNTAIGYLNLVTLLASIPILGAGLWLAHGGSSTATCESALQAPLLAIGFIVLLVSLAGFVGACYHVTWALWLYLLAMLLLVVALLGITVFGLAVTAGGGGRQVPGRPYQEFRITDYSAWLQKRVQADRYWRPALACVVASRSACPRIADWTPMDYLQHSLTPIQSGCCKPPTSCAYSQAGVPIQPQDEDCYRWNNAPSILCYQCGSCKAGVLEQVRRDWHNITVLNVVLLVLLIAIYSCGCCAFRNARRAESDHYGVNRMSKINPRWDYFWSRWWNGQREQLY
ncbi:hypothetical protein HU200_067496 [Digitaria exilis]|uniref:Tetraspanin-6 n=1 Tax=Digitaria exilis TaxID=1010633 RepID=A0A835DWB4_9POAL|nr:hypothetical protein HU200_067496 [Digitaria exilis]CAB3503708.1 unnamed protein product [Digitaria exilis]